MSELILYTNEDGKSRIQLHAEGQTVWLTQAKRAELFNVSTDNISLRLKNIFSDKELEPERTTEESTVVRREGACEVRRPVALYNLDAIPTVGYRVRSLRGAKLRRWASTEQTEYLLKGFVMDERLKNPNGRPDHFDETLARIRDIRRTWARSSVPMASFCWPRLVPSATCRWSRKPIHGISPSTSRAGRGRRGPPMPPTGPNWPPSKTRSNDA